MPSNQYSPPKTLALFLPAFKIRVKIQVRTTITHAHIFVKGMPSVCIFIAFKTEPNFTWISKSNPLICNLSIRWGGLHGVRFSFEMINTHLPFTLYWQLLLCCCLPGSFFITVNFITTLKQKAFTRNSLYHCSQEKKNYVGECTPLKSIMAVHFGLDQNVHYYIPHNVLGPWGGLRRKIPAVTYIIKLA